MPLTHPAGCWRLKVGTKRRPLPGVRAVSVVVPGRHGQIPVYGLDLETTTLPLACAVYGRTPAGADGGHEQMEHNLEALGALLGERNRLMLLRYEAGAIVRVAEVMVEAVSEPEVNVGAAIARFTAMLTIPGVLWRDEVTATWAGSANAAAQVVTPLAGSTGPIVDALVRITGPVVNPSVKDVASGGTISRASGVLAGERLLIDCAAMRAALVDSDTWDLEAGDNVTGEIQATGPGSAFRWLHLTSAVALGDPHSRAVLVTSTASSTSVASALEIRARRSFL
ncbi:hypothetical protein P3X83_29060 [Spongiactinospora sp. TRM90649]|nr:hypothetical protein [Spongiactinospora sp. TRM90649]